MGRETRRASDISGIHKGNGAHMGNLHKIASILYHYIIKSFTSQLPRIILLFFGKITKSGFPQRENRPPEGGG